MSETAEAATTAAGEGPIPMVEVEGIMFPKVFERSRPMKEHIECLRAMEMRDDDVLLCAFGKSGTHWLWEVGSMLLAGKAEYENRTKEHVMMEATDIEILQQLPSPRLLNTHNLVRFLPNQIKDGKVKVIHVYRNPKDVMVSMFYHVRQMSTPGQQMTMDTLEAMLMSDDCPCGNYFTYLREMDSFIKENPDVPVFSMSFEEMKENPEGTVRRLAKFLQVEASDELCDDIAKACSFQNLKKADEKKVWPDHFKAGFIPQMYRKGEVGDWKNHLTVAQSERIDAALEQLKDCNFRFRFTL